jgi:hypothetical protein
LLHVRQSHPSWCDHLIIRDEHSKTSQYEMSTGKTKFHTHTKEQTKALLPLRRRDYDSIKRKKSLHSRLLVEPSVCNSASL